MILIFYMYMIIILFFFFKKEKLSLMLICIFYMIRDFSIFYEEKLYYFLYGFVWVVYFLC